MAEQKQFRMGLLSRRQLLVDKKFQIPFITGILITLLIVIVLLSVLIILSTSKSISGSIYSKIVSIKNTKEMILPVVIKIGAFIILIGGVIGAYNLLKYSNKIVGPLVRYKRCLKSLGDGDLSIQIKFRDNDELKDLADMLTESVRNLNKQITVMKDNFTPLADALKEGEIIIKNNKKKKILKDSMNKIESILKKFKTV